MTGSGTVTIQNKRSDPRIELLSDGLLLRLPANTVSTAIYHQKRKHGAYAPCFPAYDMIR